VALEFTERDLSEPPWWIKEPGAKPEEGYKFIIRHPDLLVLVEDRRYRIRARTSVIGAETLMLHVWLWMGESRNYDDRIELYSLDERQGFVQAAATECKLDAALIEHDLGVITRYCESARDAMLKDFAERRQDSDATLQ